MNAVAQPIRINASTRISTILRANPAALEAIASINRHFHKLRNPLLRKVLASRVTIADAARIGGTEVGVFFEKLRDLGFISVEAEVVAPKPVTTFQPSLPPVGLTIDVREALQKGHDPFKEIMAAAEQVPENTSLLLINTFEPIPLLTILQKKGFSHFTSQEEPKLVYTYFYRSGQAKKPEDRKQIVSDIDFATLQQRYQNQLLEINVRDLEMPQPMITILDTLTRLTPEQVLLVYHRRIPYYLLNQLAERGFGYIVAEPGPEEVRLLIYNITGHELVGS